MIIKSFSKIMILQFWSFIIIPFILRINFDIYVLEGSVSVLQNQTKPALSMWPVSAHWCWADSAVLGVVSACSNTPSFIRLHLHYLILVPDDLQHNKWVRFQFLYDVDRCFTKMYIFLSYKRKPGGTAAKAVLEFKACFFQMI